jgi:hypothetical protein
VWRIIESMMKEVAEGKKQLCNELHNLNGLHNITMIKFRRMR